MKFLNNESGSIIVFFTLLVVLLLIMVGLGLDTGWVAYTRSQGQPAVDAAALVGASGLPTGKATEIQNRIEALNTSNDYVKNLSNPIDGTVNGSNVTLVSYNFTTGEITKANTVGEANGVRVALETNNPYGGSPNRAINTPVFLTPLLNWFGAGVQGTQNVSVSAVAVNSLIPSFPVVITGCPGFTTPIGDPWCTGVGGNPPRCASCADLDGDGKNDVGRDCDLIRNPDTSDTSGWTNLDDRNPVSTPVVIDLLQSAQKCDNVSGVTETICLNNGNIPPIVREIDSLFGRFVNQPYPAPVPQDDCFAIPVVGDYVRVNQCRPVVRYAQICIRAAYCPGCSGGPGPNPGVIHQLIRADITCPAPENNPYSCFSQKLVRDTKSGM